MSELKFLNDLNPQQREGAVSTEGPVLVIAGAGSGKTKMLTARMVYLIDQCRVDPRNILAVTFTNKAAQEMRERVARQLGADVQAWQRHSFRPPWADQFSAQPTIGTFHSVCIKILREEPTAFPFGSSFSILDDSDQMKLIKACLGDLQIDEKALSPKAVAYALDQAKSLVRGPEDLPQIDGDEAYFQKMFKKVYELYQKRLYENQSVDFGEIIAATVRLFKNHPEILKKYQNIFRYIHVDEYQDTNRAQYLFVKSLAAGHGNLFVVGDEDQSIYRWRGADLKNILDFEHDYPDAKVIKLEQNYRSTQNIIEASSQLIARNQERKGKTLWTSNSKGDPVTVVVTQDDLQEANFIVNQIFQLSHEGYSFSDVALFYRTNAQSRLFEEFFRKNRIPYKMVGGLRFFDRKEIKDILAYLKAVVNPQDSMSIKRIINVPQRGIGASTVTKIESIQYGEGLSFFEACEKMALGNSGAPAKKVGDFTQRIRRLQQQLPQVTLPEFYVTLLEDTGYLQELRLENSEEAQSRIENLQELETVIEDFLSQTTDQDTLTQALSFIETMALASDVAAQENVSQSSVSMMTLHTSKGLEFPVVFMVGMEEGLFPHKRASAEEASEDLEEERRLCYVGMTRAKKKLFMSAARYRRIYGNILIQQPSRFLYELPEACIRVLEPRQQSGSRADDDHYSDSGYHDSDDSRATKKSYSSVPSSSGKSSSIVGKRVRHAVYGEGVIASQEGSSDSAKVTVSFPQVGLKKFVLQYASLEFLS